jgi:hypothetical protein
VIQCCNKQQSRRAYPYHLPNHGKPSFFGP